VQPVELVKQPRGVLGNGSCSGHSRVYSDMVWARPSGLHPSCSWKKRFCGGAGPLEISRFQILRVQPYLHALTARPASSRDSRPNAFDV
jgi:hypothetical protein